MPRRSAVIQVVLPPVERVSIDLVSRQKPVEARSSIPQAFYFHKMKSLTTLILNIIVETQSLNHRLIQEVATVNHDRGVHWGCAILI
jgi:hypothetical protein